MTQKGSFQHKEWESARQLLQDNLKELRENIDSCKELNQQLESQLKKLRQMAVTEKQEKKSEEKVSEPASQVFDAYNMQD
eukprot:jgi/Galph1/5954/GphlegSOOS_G4618.1